jgi:Flp pilus assembly protein TadG
MTLMPHMKRIGRHGRPSLASERGQGLVEFALVLPLLLIVILGIVDFGKAYGYKNDETHLANAAARYAAVNGFPIDKPAPNQNAIAESVKATAPNELKNGTGSITPAGTGVTITFAFSNPTPPASVNHCIGDPVTVTVQAHYNWLHFLSFSGALPTFGADIKSSATMRLEKKYDDANPNSMAYTPTNIQGLASNCPS